MNMNRLRTGNSLFSVRAFFVAVTLAATLVATPHRTTVAADGTKRPPNVVLILSDDQGFADYSFLGHPHIQTPHIDRLAREGRTFRRAHVPSSLCRPSLAALITGMYPHQHRITCNDPPLAMTLDPDRAKANAEFQRQRQEMIHNIDEAPTLPRLLGKAGYRSFQSGKWWEGNFARGGFTAGMTHGDVTKGGRHGDDGLRIGRQTMQPVLDFLDQAAADQTPFFLWYAPMLPHSPHNPPERLLKKYRDKAPTPSIANYWAMCEWFDETVGEILTRLDEKKLSENTLVVYVCDNGWIQDPDGPNYAPRSKRSQYEGGLRTPIIFRQPGRIAPKTSDEPALSIDIAPTILTAAGLKPDASLPGINLLDDAAVAGRERIFGEVFEHNAVNIQRPESNLMYRWVIEGNWKLIVPSVRLGGSPELYDLSSDPDERTNAAESQSEVAARLRKRLDAWWPGDSPEKP